MPHDPSSAAAAAETGRGAALFVSADLPWPPDGGGRIATLRVLEGIAKRFEVDLVALADSTTVPDLRYLESICRSVTLIEHPFTFGRHRIRQLAIAGRSLLSRDPYRIRKFRSRDLERQITALLQARRYALMHLDQLGVAEYVRSSAPSTLVTQNVESDIYRRGARYARTPLSRAWARLESAKLRRAERRILARFDSVFVLADDDARLLGELGVRRVFVLPMPAPSNERLSETPPSAPTVITLGSMSWFGVEDGLLWFHREVYPRVRSRVPGVRWVLVGPNAGPAIRRLGSEPGITLLGYVPDVREALREARVGVIPLHVAGGVRMKLLDLMAWGVPSVSTTLGARGLRFEDGAGCLRRDDPDAFADAVAELLVDDALWLRTSDAGIQYVTANHSRPAFEAVLDAGVSNAFAHHRGEVSTATT